MINSFHFWATLSRNNYYYYNFVTRVLHFQVLNFSRNFLREVPPNLFYGMKSLRIVDLSDNRLTFLPEYSFREDSLERVFLAKNYFVKVPFKSFSPEVARSLNELDISDNSISSIRSSELLSQFQVGGVGTYLRSSYLRRYVYSFMNKNYSGV